jgi:SAM-dependent methyltransferase
MPDRATEMKKMSDGWNESAQAWIDNTGDDGDDSRRFIIDPVMKQILAARPYKRALDVGCGEGRFCRMMQSYGIETVGTDPTLPLLREARQRDPKGDYREGRAEKLDFADGSFDLVVSYLSLIDIPDLKAGIAEMARVLAPGGSLLIANLTSHISASIEQGWIKDADGKRLHYPIDDYLREKRLRFAWHGIDIVNWHRPLETYMQLLLAQNLTLAFFAEPAPVGGDPDFIERGTRVPWFVVMEWRKPD